MGEWQQMIPTHRSIYHGDVLEQLNYMDSQTVDVIITSPPYWSLRDYGVDEQIGLEPDFRDYLDTLSKIMKQLKRVLKDAGTCWINLGDTYAGSGKGAGSNGKSKESFNHKKRPKMVNELQSKSLHGIPQRFFVNCIDDGWIARNYIIWHKSNAMPNSVKDRFTVKYEPVMFFSKKQKYYFDLDAVRVKPLAQTIPFASQVREIKHGGNQAKLVGGVPNAKPQKYNSKRERKNDHIPGRTTHSMHKIRNELTDNKHNLQEKSTSEIAKMYGYDPEKICSTCGRSYKRHVGRNRTGGPEHYPAFALCSTQGKNPGDVWNIATKPLPEAHYAVFPIDLPLQILKCACPQNGIVLDPFFGAGTTGVAAEKLGRKWCGIDINEEYIKIARKRLNKYKNHSIL